MGRDPLVAFPARLSRFGREVHEHLGVLIASVQAACASLLTELANAAEAGD